MLSCVALRWRLKTEEPQWPFVSWPCLAGRYDGAETECYCALHSYLEKTLHTGPIEQAGRRSDQLLAFSLSMSLVQAWSERSDMSRLAR